MDRIMVSVRLTHTHKVGNLSSQSSLVSVFVDPSDNGGDLRSGVARMSGQPPGDIRLIFAGKLISDTLTIRDLDITENTIIHAVVSPDQCKTEADRDRSQTDSHTDTPVHQAAFLPDLSSQDGVRCSEERPAMKPSFYVYCKHPCQTVQPGKLRVCCRLCRDEAFTVNQDPACWEDVFTPGPQSGCCLVPGCAGRQAKFYFKCISHDAVAGESVIPLPLLKTNTRQVTCLTCGDVMSPVVVFDCTACHVICLECFTQYCHLCLNERRFIHSNQHGYTLPCPAGCEDSLIKETHHFLVLGKEKYTRYKHFGAEECLLQEGGVLCPSPGCGAGILPDASERRVVCQQEGGFGCGLVFCKNCQEAYHEGECGQRSEQPGGHMSNGSRVDRERERQARWEREESQRTIERTSKPCPQCRVPTERNGGCMHMSCSRTQCKFEWCWLCGVKWNTACLQDHWFGPDPLW